MGQDTGAVSMAELQPTPSSVLSSSLTVSIHMQSKAEGLGIKPALTYPGAATAGCRVFVLGVCAVAEKEASV